MFGSPRHSLRDYGIIVTRIEHHKNLRVNHILIVISINVGMVYALDDAADADAANAAEDIKCCDDY